MTFYVRRARDSEIEGPFTIEQINQMVRQKRLTFKWLALPDTGQGLSAAQNTPSKQWVMVADIPGFQPDPDEEKGCLSIVLILLILLGLIVVIGLIKLKDILHQIN